MTSRNLHDILYIQLRKEVLTMKFDEKRRENENRYHGNRFQTKYMAYDLDPSTMSSIKDKARETLRGDYTVSQHLQDKIKSGYLSFDKKFYEDIIHGHYDIVEVSITKQLHGNKDLRVVLRGRKEKEVTIMGKHVVEKALQNMCVVLSLSSKTVVTIYNTDVGQRHNKKHRNYGK